jgi:hypothetical protein
VFWFFYHVGLKHFSFSEVYYIYYIRRDRSLIYIGLYVTYPLFSPDFNESWNFTAIFFSRKIFKYQISRKSVQWEPSCSMRTDGQTNTQTNMAKLTATFRNVANAPKKGFVQIWNAIYRMSREECKKLRESVPYVKIYRYNPKHLYPKLNGYGDNGQRKVLTSVGSTHCSCQLTVLCMPVLQCGIALHLALSLYPAYLQADKAIQFTDQLYSFRVTSALGRHA